MDLICYGPEGHKYYPDGDLIKQVNLRDLMEFRNMKL